MIDHDLTPAGAGGAPAKVAIRVVTVFRNIGMGVAGCLVAIVMGLVVPTILLVIFFKGAFWVSEHVLPSMVLVGWIALAIDLLLLLPLAVVRVLRPWCALLILWSSYLFGLISWFLGFVLTYTLWGLGAVIFGLVFLGVGVVPFALLATLFKGRWAEFFTLVVLLVLTFGSRFVAFALEAEE